MSGSQTKARWHEFLVGLRNRPLSYLFLDVVRHLGDVVRIPMLGYFVHEPRIARAVLDHPNVSNKAVGSYGAWFTQVLGDFALFNMEGPEHRQIKSFLRGYFDRGRLDALIGDDLTRSIEAIRLRLEDGIEVDLADEMRELSTRIFGRILGIELHGAQVEGKYRQIYYDSAQLTSRGALIKKVLSPSEVDAATVIHRRLAAYTRAAYERTDQNSHSIIGGLKAENYRFAEVEGLLTALLIAGTAIVTLAVPRITAVLLDSGAIAELRDNRSLVEGAIDECLRFTTPSNVLFRATTADVTVDGHTFSKGSRIYVVFYSLMKHKRYLPQPLRLDVRRTIPPEVKHLWFGHGPHSCLGIALAHKIIGAILRMFLDLDGNLVVVRRSHARNLTFPGYKSLWIALDRISSGRTAVRSDPS